MKLHLTTQEDLASEINYTLNGSLDDGGLGTTEGEIQDNYRKFVESLSAVLGKHGSTTLDAFETAEAHLSEDIYERDYTTSVVLQGWSILTRACLEDVSEFLRGRRNNWLVMIDGGRDYEGKLGKKGFKKGQNLGIHIKKDLAEGWSWDNGIFLKGLGFVNHPKR